MSLHAQPNPEALAKLRAQRRNSTISSMIIAFLFVVLMFLILGFILLPSLTRESPVIVTYQSGDPTTELEQRKVTTAVQRRPAAPSLSAARVLAAATPSPTSVPVPEFAVPEPTVFFGDGLDFGDGWSAGGDAGGGGGFGTIPNSMRKRCSPEERMQRLLEAGGTKECEDAVVRGLRWLASTQNPDGSWTDNHQAGMTGLALLAFLGHCETPLSLEHGETVLKAIVYLVNLGVKDGRLTNNPQNRHWPYEHGIATYALAEAATFGKMLGINIPNLMEVTQKAGQLIIDNQHQSGGWDYAYATRGSRGGDLSITAWQIQALKACETTGLPFNGLRKAADNAMTYLGRLQNPSGGFGYTDRNTVAGGHDYFTLTGAGVLSFQLLSRGTPRAIRDGVRYIEQNTRFEYHTRYADLYGHYYEAQAMLNRGGTAWARYNALFRDQLLANQNPDGSWKNPGGGNPVRAAGASFVGGSRMAVHYRTCLAILMLEVYYRFLPATGGSLR
jgi:hypothetical protein